LVRQNKTAKNMKKEDFIRFITLSVLVIAAYIPSFIWMVERWTVQDTYYSHGFLVPFICLFIIWTKRESFEKLAVHPAPKTGWSIFGAAIFIHLVSTLLRVSFTSGFSLIPVIVGLILVFLGKDFLKLLWFPIAFIAFMIPLPMVATANMSFRLKLLAAQIATLIVNGLGVEAVRDGSIIKTAHASVTVEDPCSGIRSLIALIALGALMAYFSHISRPRKAVLFASSVPIAVSTNIVRITALTLASEIYGSQFAMGWFHDTMGVLVFVLAFLMLSVVGKLLE
jgi:exosortase